MGAIQQLCTACYPIALPWDLHLSQLHQVTRVPWFWLEWEPHGPGGSLQFSRVHCVLHSGEGSAHPGKREGFKGSVWHGSVRFPQGEEYWGFRLVFKIM